MVSAAASTTASMGWSSKADCRNEVMLRKQILQKKMRKRKRQWSDERQKSVIPPGWGHALVSAGRVVAPGEVDGLAEVSDLARPRFRGGCLSNVVLVALGNNEVACGSDKAEGEGRVRTSCSRDEPVPEQTTHPHRWPGRPGRQRFAW